MKLSELKVGNVYGIVPSWGYNNSSARKVETVRENDVEKATIISLDKYEYQASQRYQDQTKFVLAKQGDRSVGVIVKAVDKNGNDFYWTARLADIVEEWSKLEPIWADKNKLEQEQKLIEEAKQAKANAIKRQAQEYVGRSSVSVPQSVTDLVGKRCGNVTVHTTGYGEDTTAVATLSLADLETLIELAYQGKEQVA